MDGHRLLTPKTGQLWWATAVLLLMFGLALNSMTQKSPTFDEQGFITRGLGYLRGQNRYMRVGHPLGLNALNASFLVFDESVHLPTDHPSWAGTSFHRPSELFLWEIGNDVEHIMFLARLPTLWLGLLLAAITGRWAWQMSRSRGAGLLALTLVAFDPNILAHSRLATTDLGLAAGAVLAGFTLWHFLRRPSWPAAILAGVGFGLLQNTKFTAGLFVPLFALAILVALLVQWRARRRLVAEPASRLSGFPRRMLLMLAVAYPLAAFFTLWAAYGFQVGTLPANLPTFPQLSGLTVPLAHHLEQLLDIGGRLQQGTPAFLLGNYSDRGWWTYFPVAFALKTPLAILILLAWATVYVIRYWPRTTRATWSSPGSTPFNLAALLIPALGYFAISLTTDINLGYRHLLPILPFLFVFIATSLCPVLRPAFSTLHSPLPALRSTLPTLRSLLPALRPTLLALLILWLILATVFIHPHFLAYFNLLAGGPDNGWRVLVDSNIDWGQDLGALGRWMEEQDVHHVWLSYFGEARPEYYGINYTGLDSFPPRLMEPAARPFYPHEPAPGTYAISVTNLQGVLFRNHDQFVWFRHRQPVAKIGYSIFVYRVPATGRPVALALSGVQLDELAPDDYVRLGTNDVRPRWFDAGQSLLLPDRESFWLALGTEKTVHPQVAAWLDGRSLNRFQHSRYTLSQYDIDGLLNSRSLSDAMTTFSQGAGRLHLLAAQIQTGTAPPGAVVEVTTLWQQTAEPQPLKIFVHAVGPDGQLITQWDGLGVAWQGWRAGDRLWQSHQIPLPADAPAGDYQLWAGLYHPGSGQRWQTSTGADRVLLGTITVP